MVNVWLGQRNMFFFKHRHVDRTLAALSFWNMSHLMKFCGWSFCSTCLTNEPIFKVTWIFFFLSSWRQMWISCPALEFYTCILQWWIRFCFILLQNAPAWQHLLLLLPLSFIQSFLLKWYLSLVPQCCSQKFE